MKLIDTNLILEEIEKGSSIDDISQLVKNIKGIEVVPMKEYKWIEVAGPYMLSCSGCGFNSIRDSKIKATRYKYCPNCGARMSNSYDKK